jgi:hypothetical protein
MAQKTAAHPKKLALRIHHSEKIGPGAWEVSGVTEDGHRLSGFGVTQRQAIYMLHQRSKVYGCYTYPQ